MERNVFVKQAEFDCPVEAALSFIGGKYKPLILWYLKQNDLHYMQLQRLIPKATPKMLSQQLHSLEKCGMVRREVIPEKPPKTRYSLTPFGQSVIPVIDAMCDWGDYYIKRQRGQCACGRPAPGKNCCKGEGDGASQI